MAGARVQAQADGSVRWAFTTGGIVISSPAVGPDGTLYFGSQDNRVYAIRPGATQAATSLKWTFQTGDWVDSSPAVAMDGTIYVGSWDGKLYALRDNGSSVTKLWEYVTGAYVYASPAIGSDGTLYVGAGDSTLHAINRDGTLKWTFPVEDWIDSSPIVGPDETVYFGSWDFFVYAVDKNGNLKWKQPTEGGVVGSPALAADGTLYVGSRDGSVYAFNATGALLWTFSTNDAIEASPVIGADGTIYIGSSDGRMYAIYPDGTERWRFPRGLQPPLLPILSTAAVRADGLIVFGSSNSGVYALRPDGTLAWRTTVGDWADSSPLVAGDGSIYVGCYDRRLYSLVNASQPSGLDWAQFRRDPLRSGRQLLGAAEGTGRLINLSIRSVAGQGAETLIVGVSSGGAGTRNLLARGIGPTLALAPFNVPGAISDPVLKLFNSASEIIAENGDWSSASNAALIASTAAGVGAFPLPNPSKDSALLPTVTASNGYTAHVSSVNSETGVALVEVYDAGGADTARLVNVSARSRVGSGADVLIAGFSIVGGSRTVLIRGVGETLGGPPFSLPGALANPQLRLYSNNVFLAENDDWGLATNVGTLASTSVSVGAFALPAQAKDAVLLTSLPPGGYTAVVSGAGGITGVALVEVYEVR